MCLDEVAAQLQAVMKPNARKARPSCKKGAKKSPERPDPETEVWEVSDGEITASRGPMTKLYMLVLSMSTTICKYNKWPYIYMGTTEVNLVICLPRKMMAAAMSPQR